MIKKTLLVKITKDTWVNPEAVDAIRQQTTFPAGGGFSAILLRSGETIVVPETADQVAADLFPGGRVENGEQQ